MSGPSLFLTAADSGGITPYSALAAEAQLAPTQANFPALAHLFKCNEASVADGATLTCSITGLKLSAASACSLTNRGDGTIVTSANLTVADRAWAPPGNKKVLVLVIGKPTVAAPVVKIGETATGANYGFYTQASPSVTQKINNGGTAVPGTFMGVAVAGQWLAYAVTFNLSTNPGIQWYRRDLLVDNSGATTGDLSTITSLAQISQTALISAGLGAAMIAVMYFGTLPTAAEIKSALGWMHNNTSTNMNKTIYPGFRGRT
jgi:hypothetical protein